MPGGRAGGGQAGFPERAHALKQVGNRKKPGRNYWGEGGVGGCYFGREKVFAWGFGSATERGPTREEAPRHAWPWRFRAPAARPHGTRPPLPPRPRRPCRPGARGRRARARRRESLVLERAPAARPSAGGRAAAPHPTRPPPPPRCRRGREAAAGPARRLGRESRPPSPPPARGKAPSGSSAPAPSALPRPVFC